MAGVQQPVGQGSVIGQQKQPLRVPIQPAHGINPCGNAGQQVHHRFPALLVRHGGHIASGLIQHQVHCLRFPSQRNAVYPDVIRLRVGLLAQQGGLSVDGDPSGGDIPLCCPAGTDPGSRQQFLQSFFHSDP